jgi:beta-lactamase regulating signal transducer with metallopeptidase domain
MMHLRRRDLWAQAFLDVLCAVYWFHPFVHLARRRARTLREACCDLDVARALGPHAPSYRACLARLARTRWLAPLPHGASGWLLPRPAIAERLCAIDRAAGRRSRHHRAMAWSLLVLLAALLLPRAAPLAAPHALLQGELDAARARLARTFTERDRFGCFHRRHAWSEVQAAEQRLADALGAAPPSSPFPEE